MRKLINQLIKITWGTLIVVIASYYLYFYISPSVTVINNSERLITKASVSLPNSHLNFAPLEPKQINTLYYSLSQDDGSYHYSFNVNGKVIVGYCGYLTNNEINKRIVITVSKSNQIVCS